MPGWASPELSRFAYGVIRGEPDVAVQAVNPVASTPGLSERRSVVFVSGVRISLAQPHFPCSTSLSLFTRCPAARLVRASATKRRASEKNSTHSGLVSFPALFSPPVCSVIFIGFCFIRYCLSGGCLYSRSVYRFSPRVKYFPSATGRPILPLSLSPCPIIGANKNRANAEDTPRGDSKRGRAVLAPAPFAVPC